MVFSQLFFVTSKILIEKDSNAAGFGVACFQVPGGSSLVAGGTPPPLEEVQPGPFFLSQLAAPPWEGPSDFPRLRPLGFEKRRVYRVKEGCPRCAGDGGLERSWGVPEPPKGQNFALGALTQSTQSFGFECF